MRKVLKSVQELAHLSVAPNWSSPIPGMVQKRYVLRLAPPKEPLKSMSGPLKVQYRVPKVTVAEPSFDPNQVDNVRLKEL